jgi:hypothetical protein
VALDAAQDAVPGEGSPASEVAAGQGALVAASVAGLASAPAPDAPGALVPV